MEGAKVLGQNSSGSFWSEQVCLDPEFWVRILGSGFWCSGFWVLGSGCSVRTVVFWSKTPEHQNFLVSGFMLMYGSARALMEGG